MPGNDLPTERCGSSGMGQECLNIVTKWVTRQKRVEYSLGTKMSPRAGFMQVLQSNGLAWACGCRFSGFEGHIAAFFGWA